MRLYYYWKNKPATNGINRMTYLSVTAWNALPVNNLKRALYLDTGAFKVSAQYKLTYLAVVHQKLIYVHALKCGM